jgi:hypothetical protein
VSGTSLAYLPDGQQILFPEDPNFYDEEERIPAWKMTHDFGQLGFWVAQRPLFEGLQTTSVSVSSAVWTSLVLQTEMIDNWDMHSTTTNTAQVVPLETANGDKFGTEDLYLCIGYTPMASGSTTSSFIAGLFSSYTGVNYEGMKITSATGHAVDCLAVDILAIHGNPFAGAPYVSLIVFQAVGSAVSTLVSGKTPSLSVGWCGSLRSYTQANSLVPASPHVLTAIDQVTGDATGASPAGGVKVPINENDFWPAAFLMSPPVARVTSQGSSQVFSNLTGVFTSIQFPTSDIGIWPMWSSGSNTKLTFLRDGLYFVYGLAAATEPAAKVGYRAAQLLVTLAAGGTVIYGGNSTQCMTGSQTTGTAVPAMDLIQAVAGDTVELQFAHTNNVSLSAKTGSGDCSRLMALWVSR